jgi:hypothetical protein
MFILLAGMSFFGSGLAVASERPVTAPAPQIPALAYGYGDHDDRYDRDDDRRGWGHDRYSDAAIHDRVKRSLWRELGERARFIDVGVRGGFVILTGQVDYRRDRYFAYNVAANTRGVRAVDNRIYVRRTYR